MLSILPLNIWNIHNFLPSKVRFHYVQLKKTVHFMLHLHLKNPSIKVYGYSFGMRGVGVREQLPFALVLPILMGVNS